MANELKHGDQGDTLTKAEFEGIGLHVLESQATGDIVYASSSSQLRRLGVGSTNDILRITGGLPDWQATSFITSLGTITTGVWQGTDVGVAYGGTGVSTLTDGGVLLGSGASAITAMAVLTDGQMIVGDGSGDPVAESGATLRTSIGVGTGDTLSLTGLTLSTDLTVANGGTGASTFTANGVLVGNGGSAIGAVDMSTKGHILIGDGSGNPQMLAVGSNDQVLTADSGETTGVKWAAAGGGGGVTLSGSTNNTVVTVTGSNAILGEANLTFDGTNLSIADGNLILSTAGKGIDFSATAGTSATGAATVSELLDDYEEGTWTPRITDTDDNTGWTGDIKNGVYTKIGNIILFRFNIRSTSMGGLTTSNTAFIEGLPFASSAGEHFVDFCYGVNLAIAAGNNIGGYVDASDVRITLALWDATGGSTTMLLSEISANGSLTGGGFYHV